MTGKRGEVSMALQRDLALLCDTGSRDDPLGPEAYQAWIRYLMAPVSKAVSGDPRALEPLHGKHNERIGELAERRAYAGTFLAQAAEVLPSVALELQQARYCHQAIHDLLWRVWQTLGAWHKTDDAKLMRYAKPEFRVELASLVRRLRAWDLEAGWQVKLVAMPADEEMLPGVKRINDVILSCLYGLPVATTHNGKSVVVIGYNHLAGETLRVRVPGQSETDSAEKIRINDKGW